MEETVAIENVFENIIGKGGEEVDLFEEDPSEKGINGPDSTPGEVSDSEEGLVKTHSTASEERKENTDEKKKDRQPEKLKTHHSHKSYSSHSHHATERTGRPEARSYDNKGTLNRSNGRSMIRRADEDVYIQRTAYEAHTPRQRDVYEMPRNNYGEYDTPRRGATVYDDRRVSAPFDYKRRDMLDRREEFRSDGRLSDYGYGEPRMFDEKSRRDIDYVRRAPEEYRYSRSVRDEGLEYRRPRDMHTNSEAFNSRGEISPPRYRKDDLIQIGRRDQRDARDAYILRSYARDDTFVNEKPQRAYSPERVRHHRQPVESYHTRHEIKRPISPSPIYTSKKPKMIDNPTLSDGVIPLHTSEIVYPRARFFILTACDFEFLVRARARNIWTMYCDDISQTINTAFKQGDVYVFFSVENSNRIQGNTNREREITLPGYARVDSLVSQHKQRQGRQEVSPGGFFHLEWIKTFDIAFERIGHILSDIHKKPIDCLLDGDEIGFIAGNQICSIFSRGKCPDLHDQIERAKEILLKKKGSLSKSSSGTLQDLEETI